MESERPCYLGACLHVLQAVWLYAKDSLPRAEQHYQALSTISLRGSLNHTAVLILVRACKMSACCLISSCPVMPQEWRA